MELIKNDRTNQMHETIRNEKRRVGHLRDPRLESNDLKVYGWKEKRKKKRKKKQREIRDVFERFWSSFRDSFDRFPRYSLGTCIRAESWATERKSKEPFVRRNVDRDARANSLRQTVLRWRSSSFTTRWEIHHRPTDKLADRTFLSLGGKLDRSKLAFHGVEIKLDNFTEEPESNVAILSRYDLNRI